MKRNQNRRETGGCSKSGESSSPAAGKEKSVWGLEEEGLTGGMDELLAVLGYKVRSSDMADVALKLEQLEVVLGSVHTDGISHLSNDAVHYNPSDLSTWVETMLSDIDPTRIHYHDSFQSPIYGDVSNYDLGAIPGSAAYPRVDSEEEKERKRVKTEPGSDLTSCLSNSVESTRPMVLIDSQETGVRLVHSLLACAEAVQQNNMELADALVKHVGILAASTTTQIGAMRKVATYFAEGLARRIYRIYPRDVTTTPFDVTLHANFYESCPYLKFAHFTANQAILESFTTHHSRVHVIDFGINQGLEWPALIQALALRPSGSPVFRLTGIGPQPSEIVGRRLAQLAETLGVKFEYKSLVLDNLSDLQPDMLEARPESESIAVNSVFELHRVLAQPGSIDRVFSTVKAVKPKVFTLVEQEANHNSPVFLDRFTESLHYYSSLFDSLEGPPSQDRVLSELYLGKQILNLVAFEGVDRTVRHEKLVQWRNRFGSAGFERVHLGSNAYKQASMLLELHNGADGYKVEENDGCLFLGWHTRPLIATSAWKLAEKRVN